MFRHYEVCPPEHIINSETFTAFRTCGRSLIFLLSGGNKMIRLYILLLAGFAALIKGADLFVDGSSSLAGHLKVPKVIIGLTLVAMGTSAPELAVSVSAALKGANEIAMSNVVGSNIFNLLCVLGLCSVIHPLPVDKEIINRDMPVSIIATLLLMLMTSLHALSGIKLFTRPWIFPLCCTEPVAFLMNRLENV